MNTVIFWFFRGIIILLGYYALNDSVVASNILFACLWSVNILGGFCVGILWLKFITLTTQPHDREIRKEIRRSLEGIGVKIPEHLWYVTICAFCASMGWIAILIGFITLYCGIIALKTLLKED